MNALTRLPRALLRAVAEKYNPHTSRCSHTIRVQNPLQGSRRSGFPSTTVPRRPGPLLLRRRFGTTYTVAPVEATLRPAWPTASASSVINGTRSCPVMGVQCRPSRAASMWRPSVWSPAWLLPDRPEDLAISFSSIPIRSGGELERRRLTRLLHEETAGFLRAVIAAARNALAITPTTQRSAYGPHRGPRLTPAAHETAHFHQFHYGVSRPWRLRPLSREQVAKDVQGLDLEGTAAPTPTWIPLRVTRLLSEHLLRSVDEVALHPGLARLRAGVRLRAATGPFSSRHKGDSGMVEMRTPEEVIIPRNPLVGRDVDLHASADLPGLMRTTTYHSGATS